MATRESLNKLNASLLRKLAEENGIDTSKKRKSELINEVLTSQVSSEILTPVAANISSHTALLIPSAVNKENLPPFNQVKYSPFSSFAFTPVVLFTTIYNFMVARKTESGGEISGYKGLDKALMHYDAGDIQELQVSKVDESVVYVKAVCLASMKKQKYDVYICFLEAVPIHAFCLCPVGLTQSCSHIGALLFALANRRTDLDDTGSCTSNPCRWNIPSAVSRSTQKPRPISSLKFNKPKIQEGTAEVKNDERHSINFDPRHSTDQAFDVDDALKHLQKLKEIFPNTGMNHIWNIPDDVPDAVMEEEVETALDPLQKEMENMVFSEDNVPPMTIREEVVAYIEMQTRAQRYSQIWKDLHLRRITSSIFGDVLRSGSSPVSLIDKIMNGCSLDRYPHLPAAVQWGIDNEQTAKDQYLDLKRSLGPVTLVETGLTLCSTHSFLGASSDGRVFENESDGPGILEVKCPFSLKNNKINHMEICDIIELSSNEFCLERSGLGFTLKKSHKFYDQVQGEMAIMGLPWCDFVVWTAAKRNNICVDRVYFDPEHVQMMLPKLVQFYVNHIYPLLIKK